MAAATSIRTRPPRTARKGGRAARSGRPEQMHLEIEPEGTLDQRIQWAKTTAGNYEDMAAKEADADRRGFLERRAARWNKHVLDLIELRRQSDAQMDLF